MRNETLSVAFLISLAVHISVILSAAAVVHEHDSRQKEVLFVNLIDAPRQPPQRINAPPHLKRIPPPAPLQLKEPKEAAAPSKTSAAKPEPIPAPVPPVLPKRNPRNLKPPRAWRRLPESKEAAARPGPGIYSAEVTSVLFPEQELPAVAVRRHQAWAEALAHRVCLP